MLVNKPYDSDKSFQLSKPALKALFIEIGEEKGLREILKDFYQRMAADLLIGYFFDGKDLQRIAEIQGQFLLKAMGARASYSGKPPALAHQTLPPILQGHFDRRLRLLEATLKDHGLSDEKIQLWVKFEEAFRDGIVKEES